MVVKMSAHADSQVKTCSSPDSRIATKAFVLACVEGHPELVSTGYHLAQITKGELGEPSKIKEEFEEFLDAVKQNAKIMAVLELADMLGAMKAYLEKHHPGTTLDDILKMMSITERAFRNGHRS